MSVNVSPRSSVLQAAQDSGLDILLRRATTESNGQFHERWVLEVYAIREGADGRRLKGIHLGDLIANSDEDGPEDLLERLKPYLRPTNPEPNSIATAG